MCPPRLNRYPAPEEKMTPEAVPVPPEETLKFESLHWELTATPTGGNAYNLVGMTGPESSQVIATIHPYEGFGEAQFRRIVGIITDALCDELTLEDELAEECFESLMLISVRKLVKGKNLSFHNFTYLREDGSEVQSLPAHALLIAIALGWGFKVTVAYEGEIDVANSTDIAEILDAVNASEEVELIFTNQEDVRVGWAQASVYGLDANESVMDHTIEEWLDEAMEAIGNYFNDLEEDPSIAITSEQ